MTTGDGDLLASPLTILGLTLRSYNALLNNGISTVGDLVARTDVDLATPRSTLRDDHARVLVW